MFAFLAALAWAQEPPVTEEASDRPLAIPLDAVPPEPRPQRPPAADGRYRLEALSIRNVAEYYATPGTVTSYGWGWGRVGIWTPPSVVRQDDWAVFRGPVRLDVPSFLELTGDPMGRAQLDRRIQSARSASQALIATAIGGGAATIGGLIGIGNARTVQDEVLWRQVTTVGVVALVGGAVTSSFPAARARRLAAHPSETLSYDEAIERVEAYNANLPRGGADR